MVNKKNLAGILILVLVFGMMVIGCDDNLIGYTFEFRLSCPNYLTTYGETTKIEFINGSNKDAPVIKTEMTNISSGETTSIYKVSGFTEKNEDNKCIYGIKLTWRDEVSFKYASAIDMSKILITLTTSSMNFSNGSW